MDSLMTRIDSYRELCT